MSDEYVGARARQLAALHRLDILDTPAEEAFDRLTRLASRLVGTPVALAVLVDEDRQFFKSQVGLPEPWASRRETPLSHSFCQHVVADRAPLIVADARLDERLSRNLATRELDVIAYAGVPLVCEGEVVGSFCVIDSHPRAWTDAEVEVIGDLAAAAMSELALRLAAREQDTLIQTLRDSEARYRSVVAATAEGVVLQHANGEITACNEAAERILGLSAAQMMGRSSLDPRWRAVHEDGTDYPGEHHPSMVTLRTGRAIRSQVMGIHKPDGALTWISVSTEPLLREGASKPYAVVATFADITEPRRRELQLASHAREQDALRTLATLVASEAPPRAVFASAAEHAVRILGAEAGGVVRLEKAGEARLVGAWAPAGLPTPRVGDLVDLRLKTATAAALQSRRVSQVEHSGGGLEAADAGTVVPGGVGLAAPIEVNGGLWGVVSLLGGRAIAEVADAGQRLARFADLVGLAVAGADAREQLARLASVDHLTGLYNQRAFSDRLDEEVRRARRHDRPLSLVVFDIDHFKLINDTHGHESGNAALAEFAERLLDLKRGGEIVARIGGEEFAWILPDTDGQSAQAAAERARLVICDTPFRGIGRVTTSAGICALTDASGAQELVRHADLALYWAKSTSRNATFRYSAEALELLPAEEQSRRLEAAKALAAIRALAGAVDARDPSTQRHSERVADLAALLARAAGWASERIALLKDVALVHDVGKIGVPDDILQKPGPLTEAEFEQVKEHASLGAQMVVDVLTSEQVEWVRHHHEAFDGSGYPDGLAGDAIPEGARIIALADAWDAMTVARPYGVPRSRDEAIAEVRRHRGQQFCPAAASNLLQLARDGALGLSREPAAR